MSPDEDNKAAQTAVSLSRVIFAWSFSCARLSIDEFSELLLEQGFTTRQNQALVMEMLSFFLVMFEHYSLSVCDESFLDRVGSRTVQEAIDLTAAELDGDSGNMDRLGEQLYAYYKSAAEDYRSCRFVIEDEPDYEGTRTVIGRLSARISAVLHRTNASEAGIAASSIAAQGLAESGLRSRIREACVALG